MDEEGLDVVTNRKGNYMSFLKNKVSLVSYFFLAIIVYLAVRIRTRNLGGLRDVTTGTWTLGPDLDPFLFLRYAKEIVETGTLAAIDMMRYVPLGFPTNEGFRLHYYLIAWFHNILGPLFGVESVTHSAVLYPVFMFALTVVAFFFLVRKIFVKTQGIKKSNVIALVASLFLSVMPVILPRTIAGIPEKESAAFLFLFLAFYFFLSAWQTERKRPRYIFSILAGIFTAAMANIWGGYTYIFLVLGLSTLVAFVFGQVDKKKLRVYTVWILSSMILMYFSAPRFGIKNFLTSITVGSGTAVLLILWLHFFVFDKYLKKYFDRTKLRNFPELVLSVVTSLIILALLATIFIQIDFVPTRISSISENLIKPAASRLIQTVAENRQPYFTGWANNFGPLVKGFPLTFWLFFTGSIYLFSHLAKIFRKKERIILTTSYTLFLFALIFSRYSGSGLLNGENFISLLVYSLGVLIFIGSIATTINLLRKMSYIGLRNWTLV